ncbi:MAG TPA: cytochrome c oxidase assembly protein [Gaiellales bacterium]
MDALPSPGTVQVHTHSVALASFASQWSADPGPLIAAAIALALFTHGFIRLRRRGRRDHASWDRAALFGLGVAVSVIPLVSPIDPLSDDYLLSVHMFEHVALGDAGPALMVCAVRGPLLVFMLPGIVLRPLARSARIRSGLGYLTRPRVSLAAWVFVMGAWHLPWVYDYAVAHQTVHDLEHLSFAIVGVLVWIQLIDPARHGRLRVPQRLLFALALFVFGQVLADVLLLSLTPLYPHYADQPIRVMGVSPLLDQRLAGFVMMIEQALSLGTCALVLHLSTRRHTAVARPSEATPGRPAEKPTGRVIL